MRSKTSDAAASWTCTLDKTKQVNRNLKDKPDEIDVQEINSDTKGTEAVLYRRTYENTTRVPPARGPEEGSSAVTTAAASREYATR